MSGIKKLAGQTMWYGVSSIAARFISYLLTPYLTRTSVLQVSDYGKMSLVYAAIPLLNVLFTYGFETAYFRFSQRKEYQSSIYSTASISLFISTVILSSVFWLFRDYLASFAGIPEEPQLIKLSIAIIALDTLTAIPFAKLRYDGRPVMYAFIRICSILLNIITTVFFLSYCPKILAHNPSSWIGLFYRTDINPVTYVIVANLLSSGLAFLLLIGQIGSIKLHFNIKLWKEMMIYSLPLIIVGLGGMINETFDRLMLNWWVPGSVTFKEEQVGIYSACYKLSLLISLFIQAFRMGAEPFFFKQAEGLNPQRTYARVMKFFVITVTLMFLVVSLYLPVIKYFVGKTYWAGLGVVPILLLANIFLGIYYNLSIWYKLGNKTMAGAYITLIGALITLVINFIFIRWYSFMACAWATFFCYGSMMV
ncbi:MAG: lipopolysaccharide biosynthesis protein, partial [Segetibacter sp.]